MNLSLAATTNLLSEREAELAELDRQLSDLQSALPKRERHVEHLAAELGPLEARKRAVIEEAREAQRKRGTGGMAADLEERGRWLKGVEGGLSIMLGV
jgi:chromosome segregation ATPase